MELPSFCMTVCTVGPITPPTIGAINMSGPRPMPAAAPPSRLRDAARPADDDDVAAADASADARPEPDDTSSKAGSALPPAQAAAQLISQATSQRILKKCGAAKSAQKKEKNY